MSRIVINIMLQPQTLVTRELEEAPPDIDDDDQYNADQDLINLNRAAQIRNAVDGNRSETRTVQLGAVANVTIKKRAGPNYKQVFLFLNIMECQFLFQYLVKYLTFLTFQKTKNQIDKIHPRDSKNQPYTCCYSTCTFDTGSNCLCGTTTNTKGDDFGLGISLYFKFIKSTISMIFLLLLLNGILFLVYNRSKLTWID